ncbi:hypothetical protein GGS23DRAFT_596738 [Durotheca rogersii]|uniref:uncharacterized protein n=1 Tax=Durotheca rogersii TaxID=419775 RepID=UPI0022211F1B|nr:uncharacterized protein GGS23DRAFT_596738 [Durotheca rogersii]KAI5863565.1 hypothetical protein GGS23DRAFT_596738 [Durotheca rogersii]
MWLRPWDNFTNIQRDHFDAIEKVFGSRQLFHQSMVTEEMTAHFSLPSRPDGAFENAALSKYALCTKRRKERVPSSQGIIDARATMVVEPSTPFTDHKPLTWFLHSSAVEDIYARWASKLRLSHFKIDYISGPRIKAADVLSRTIFPRDSCDDVDHLKSLGAQDDNGL